MVNDLQNWCSEAKLDGTSSRSWQHLKQMYLIKGADEETLRANLESMALNNHLTITYEPDDSAPSGQDELVVLCGR